MQANAANRYFRDFSGTEMYDKENLNRLSKLLYNTNLSNLNAAHNLEEAMTNLLEQALTYM